MKNELEKVRAWAEARIKAGEVPDWSWDQHVKLIEAADALLHDMSVVGEPPRPAQKFGRNFRLIERAGEHRESVRVTPASGLKRKAGAFH